MSAQVKMEGLLIPNMDPYRTEVEWLPSHDLPTGRLNDLPLPPNDSVDTRPISLPPLNMSHPSHDLYLTTMDDLFLPPSQNFSATRCDHQLLQPLLPSSIDYYQAYPPLSSTTPFPFPSPPPPFDFPIPLDHCCNDAAVSCFSGTGSTTQTAYNGAGGMGSSKTSFRRLKMDGVDQHHQDIKFEINDGGLDGSSSVENYHQELNSGHEMEINGDGYGQSLVVVKSESYHCENHFELLEYSEEDLREELEPNYSDIDDYSCGIEVALGQYGRQNSTNKVSPALLLRSSSCPTEDNYSKKRITEDLGFAELQKYFDMPISAAARRLNVGVTVLKKRCRQLNIRRWPHRKIKSLQALINNVKELGLITEVERLEENVRMLKEMPGLDLTNQTKKLRQHCFKANYKKRKTMGNSSA